MLIDGVNFYADPTDGKGFLLTDEPDRRTWVWINEDDGEWYVWEIERVEPILEMNKALYNENGNKRWSDMELVASIPNAIYWHGDFAKAREDGDRKWITKFLNNSDNRNLRTREGEI